MAGRGELQLGVLIETMRREGFELSISRPRVLFKTDPETGQRLEPIEEVQIDVDEEYSGIVVDKISQRKGELMDMRPSGGGKTRLTFFAPTRGLIGYQGEFLTDTRGTGDHEPPLPRLRALQGPIEGRRNGVLISNGDGAAVAYALWNLEDRGPMFITPGTQVYEGMIIGEHTRGNDLEVNPDQGQAAHQHPHHREGRGGAPDAADPDDPGAGDRLYRRRRAGRGDAEIDPAAQAPPRSQRAQARPARRRGGRRLTPGGVGPGLFKALPKVAKILLKFA